VLDRIPTIPQRYLVEIWCEKSTMNDVLTEEAGVVDHHQAAHDAATKAVIAFVSIFVIRASLPTDLPAPHGLALLYPTEVFLSLGAAPAAGDLRES
jgi:hypothetical protein